MRFELKLELKGNGPYLLPINYQYPLSAWIYKVIHQGNNKFAHWLHEKGYMDKKRQYKLFTFSQLNIDKFTIDNDRLVINNPLSSLIISFFANEAAEPFIKGLFQDQKGSMGDKTSQVEFTIQQISKLQDPQFSGTTIYQTLSPIVVSKTPDERGQAPLYLHPEDPDFVRILNDNLVNKYTAWMLSDAGTGNQIPLGQSDNFEFRHLSKPKPRLITIKANTPQQTRVRGFMMKFSLQAPAPLLQMGYHAGFGEKNSLGFGCVGVVG
jgi:CRISPR-associated endoribonuclease Cas6